MDREGTMGEKDMDIRKKTDMEKHINADKRAKKAIEREEM